VSQAQLDAERAAGIAVGEEAPPPHRPGMEICRYYMRTGSCAYGPLCKWDVSACSI
jgi:Zinc finger C-x8-C-x5-C-x3-H type (and similar)